MEERQPEATAISYRDLCRKESLRSDEHVLTLFFTLCAVIPLLSGLLLFFLACARKELFGTIDPSLMVTPFLSFILAIPSAILSMVFTALYAHARSSRIAVKDTLPAAATGDEPPVRPAVSRSRFWLYPAAAFGTIAVILFILGTVSITYLIIL